MKQFIFTITFLISLTTTVFCQSFAKIEPCKVTIDDFPTIENLRLGMSISEVESKIGKINNLKPLLKYERIAFIKPDLSKYGQIELIFLDDSLMQISYNLNFSSKHGSIEEYSKNISKNFGLPVLGWRYFTTNFSDGSGLGEMQCYGFEINISLHKINGREGTSIRIKDINLTPTLLLREYEENKIKFRQSRKKSK